MINRHRNFLLLSIASLAFVSACEKKVPQDSQTHESAIGKSQDCNGEIYFFHLVPTKAIPDMELIFDEKDPRWNKERNWQNKLAYHNVTSIDHSKDKMRFEICASFNNEFTLKSISHLGLNKSYGYNVPINIKMSDDTKVKNLDKMLAGDYEDVSIEHDTTDNETSERSGFVIKSAKNPAGRPFLYYASFDGGADKVTFDYKILAGEIAEGDNFGDLLPEGCEGADARVYDSKIELGTAQITLNYCSILAPGDTSGFHITKITVQDSNPLLNDEQKKAISLEGDLLQKSLVYRWNHHNGCDSFALNLAHASYSATSRPYVGCDRSVPDAPTRNMDDKGDALVYKTRYLDKPWSEVKSHACLKHYIYNKDCK